MHVTPRLAAAALALALTAGCTGDSEPEATAPVVTEPEPQVQLPAAEAPTDPRQALELVPATADVVTITNFVALRQANGFPDLTGDSTPADREAFWASARRTSVLLTDGLLRPDEPTLLADYGFGQDDVQFEVSFSGPEGDGFVLGMRADLPVARVRRALDDGVGPFADAELLPEQRLVVRNVAAEGEEVWATEPTLLQLTSDQDETTYLRRGCVGADDAMNGVPPRQRDAILGAYDLTNQIRPLELYSVSFGGGLATGRLGVGRNDLIVRTDIAEDWPPSAGFAEAFPGLPLFDSSTGRVADAQPDPVAAARLTRAEMLPFAICQATAG